MAPSGGTPASQGPAKTSKRAGSPAPLSRPAWALLGFLFGAPLWLAFTMLVGNPLNLRLWMELAPAAGLAAGALAATRARWLLVAFAVLVGAGLAIVGGTPLIGPAARGLVRADPLAPADAVMVLSGDIHQDGEPNELSFDRIMQGIELVRQGYAPRLVVTRIAVRPLSYVPAIRARMRRLGFQYPVLEIGSVHNTHDEAVAAAALVRERGWKRLILVTSPLHSRRSVATFRRAGVPVLSAPCIDHAIDLGKMDGMENRLRAFQSWLHEVIGYEIYRRRGWI